MQSAVSYVLFWLDLILEYLTLFLGRLPGYVSSVEGQILESSQFAIKHSLAIGGYLGLGLVSILALGLIGKIRRRRVVRTKSLAQFKHLKSAKLAYKRLLMAQEDPEELRRLIKLDGWSFELLVLYVFQKHSRNLKWIATPKLTGDYGVDGAVVTKDGVYIIQSKYYSSHVSIEAVRDLAKLVDRLNTRKNDNNWHKAIGIPKKYTRDPDIKFIGVLATTGRLSEDSRRICTMQRVKIMYWSLLIDSIKKDSLVFF